MNKKTLLAGLAMASLAPMAVDAAEPSLCTRLADEARRAPPATWAQPDPLSAWVKPAQPAKPSPTVTAMANDARWRELLAASESRPMAVQQLADTSVYVVDEVAGTAHCQSLVLVDARPGRPSRQLKPPFDLDGTQLCTTQSAGFARVLGRPAIVVGGAPSMTSPDLRYRMATWTGQAWAQRCSITLRRQTAMTAAQRFCAPGSTVCDAGQPVAQRLAQAYEAGTLDAQAFNAGRKPDAAVAAALNPLLDEPGAIGNMNPPFPMFGAEEQPQDAMRTVFSNAAPSRLPVWVNGRWWLAAVGRSGVGWREGDAVLVALFAPPGRSADGVASYQFVVGPTALRDVTTADDGP
ncbi:MAG: hypothetical protein EOP35_15760 [Rubrivivax sp.]|nr:MAG: hypothetical protein EOP35_15760 [Rubrivivax sp.]